MSWLVPPEKFDANEWFIVGCLAAGWFSVWRMGKHFPRSMLILLLAGGLMSALCVDLVLGAPPLDYYDINDTSKVDLFDLLLYAVYPPFGVLFLYVYNRLRIQGPFNLAYILLCSGFGLLIEWGAEATGVFIYKGWSIWYSFTIYLLVQSGYIALYRIIGKWYSLTRSPLIPAKRR
jgi:hypothetical protein